MISWEGGDSDKLDPKHLTHGRVEEVPWSDHDDLVPWVGQHLQAYHQSSQSPVGNDAVIGFYLELSMLLDHPGHHPLFIPLEHAVPKVVGWRIGL